MSKGIGGHQSAKMISDTWLTPPDIITALGPFDLDPCAAPNMPWRTASRMLTVADLSQIYNLVEQIAPDKTGQNKNYRAKIRQQLQYHFTRIAEGRYTNKFSVCHTAY